MKIPISKYMAYNSPENTVRILDLYGVQYNSQNPKELASRLSDLIKKEGESVLADIGNLHPDKDLVLAVEEMKAEKSGSLGMQSATSSCDGGQCSCKKKEKTSGACGCSSFSGGGAWNNGEGAFKSNTNPIVDDYLVYGADGKGSSGITKEAMLFGGIALILAYSLYKNS